MLCDKLSGVNVQAARRQNEFGVRRGPEGKEGYRRFCPRPHRVTIAYDPCYSIP
jgi:hypothetical protein